MRLLHTGDWHVGKRLRGRSRDDETAAALDQVVEAARDAAVDAVLVAGDVFELKTSTPESDGLVFDALVRLRDTGARVVVIPGNHDSWQRWEALGTLLTPLGVDVVPKVARPTEGGMVEVPSRDGTEAALVACIPFVPERRFGDAAALFDDRASLFSAYDEGMGSVMAGMAAAFRPEDRVNVLMAHVMMDGARTGGGEQELTIGMTYAVHPARLPGTASYVALGHLHRPQAVPAAPCPARFAGSLIQLDFGEAEQDKSVVLVEVKVGKPAKARTLPITAGRRLLDVRGTLDELAAKPGEVGDAYLRVTVETEGPVPGIVERVRELLPNAVDVIAHYERQDGELPHEGMRSLAPPDQFLHYYQHAHGVDEVPPDLLTAFDRVYADVAEGTG
jgi:DNA repair protein SbcD/Mre11